MSIGTAGSAGCPQNAVERFNEAIVRGLAWPGKVQRHVVRIGLDYGHDLCLLKDRDVRGTVIVRSGFLQEEFALGRQC